jgi:hypothetical protein
MVGHVTFHPYAMAAFPRSAATAWTPPVANTSSFGAAVAFRTAAGVVSRTAHVHIPALRVPRCRHPERLAPLLVGASVLLAALPKNSATKVNAAVALFRRALDYFGVEPADVDYTIPLAIIMLRACPPIGVDIPAAFGDRPVLPTTAAADIDNLRRASREGIAGMERFRTALYDDHVTAFVRNIGARVHKLRTDKRPLLFSAIETFVLPTLDSPTTASDENVRDTFALVLGLCFGTRVSELVGLDGEHVNPLDLGGGEDAVRVTFVHTKTRQSAFGTHQPWQNVSSHPLLLRAYDLFNARIGFSDGLPIFHVRAKAHTWRRLSPDWFAQLVKRVDPACVPHSTRVGLATELWAAGASVADIMAAGRWASAAAVLYIVGTLDKQVVASRSLGTAMVRYTAAGLRQQLGTSVDVWQRVSGADAAARWGAELAGSAANP